jgi:hypothetical protein
MQARLLDGHVLKTIDFGRIGQPENRADLSTPDAIVNGDGIGNILPELRQLPDLFLERHLLQKVIYAIGYLFNGIHFALLFNLLPRCTQRVVTIALVTMHWPRVGILHLL